MGRKEKAHSDALGGDRNGRNTTTTTIEVGAMKNSTVQDAEHGADCRCNECLFEGPEVESTDELIAKGWLKPEDVERDKPPVVLHRLPDWLSEDDLPDAWQLPRMLPARRCNPVLS